MTTLRQLFARPQDTVAHWIALTTLAAMLTSLALNGVFNVLAGVWAQPPLLETGLMEKVATITRILDAVAPAQRSGLVRAASDQVSVAHWFPRHADAGLPILADPSFHSGAPRLEALLERPEARIESYEPSDWPAELRNPRYALMVQLSDGSWAEFSVPARSWGLNETPRTLIILLLTLSSTLLVALIATRYLAAPLQRFAEGARRFGVDFRAPPIAVVGPREIRQAIQAFNATQAQLQHFLDDRTQMLAAISHDLRSPLTRMRLRGEFIEDAEQQAKLFKDVDEMQAMITSALEFFRDDARLEQATAFDLAQLLNTVIDDYKDAGVEVAYQGPERFVYVGRPIGLKRALINLIDNAIKYGREPEVYLQAGAERVQVQVLDRGAGIAAEQLERVFAPFYRIEGSRNKHTGGVGLGLSAARAIVLEHGGSLLLADREGGGLVAKVILPKGQGLPDGHTFTLVSRRPTFL